MKLKDKRVGIAVTGSFCTFTALFTALSALVEAGADVTTIFSEHACQIDSRFGRADDFLNKAEYITGKQPITALSDAEPIGPRKLLDILAILPCTGNTIAKLANGITDTPALMAAKAHLRNNRPVVIAVSTNDALGMNLRNIGLLMNAKNIYFVPFCQDAPEAKPNSLIARTELLLPTLEAALDGKQLQPLLAVTAD